MQPTPDTDKLPGDQPGNAKPITEMPPDASDSGLLSTALETHIENYDGFDATIHAVNDDGTPKRKVDGTYALKRGRKAGTVAAALPPKNAPLRTAVGEAVNPSINLDEAARQSANMVINVAVWTLGDDVGKPVDKAEADGLRLSFKNYYEARGVPNIPPEIGLIIALGSYIGQRLMHEKSKTKIERIATWLKAKIRD